MQAKIETLKAKNSNNEEYLVYPRTLIKCVTNEHGENLEEKINDSFLASEGRVFVDYGDRESTDNYVPIDADTLEGHSANYFATAEALNTVISNKANASDLANYLPLSGGTIDGNLGVTSSSATDRLFHLGNSKRFISMVTNANGTHYIYDSTNNKFIYDSDANGNTIFNGTATGNLPLSGGTIDGIITLDSGSTSAELTIKRVTSGGVNAVSSQWVDKDSLIHHVRVKNADTGKYTTYDFGENGLSVHPLGKPSTTYDYIHTGNVGSYALPKDGTAVKAESLPMGYSFPNGLGDKPYTLVAQYKINNPQINTKVAFFISNYFATQRSGILEVSCRWANEDGTTPAFLTNQWTVCNGIDNTNMFIVTYSCQTGCTDAVINLYIKTTGWTSYNVTKIAEHAWGLPANDWTMIKSYNNENAIAAIPSTETQVPSTIAVLSNPVAGSLPLSGGTLSGGENVLSLQSNTADSYMYFKTVDGNRTTAGYYNGLSFISNEASLARIGVNNSGIPQYWTHWNGNTKYDLLHTGNTGSAATKDIVHTTSDPGAGTASSYKEGSIICVYE